MRESNVPGAAITLLRQGQPRWAGGFGVRNAKTGQPVTEGTIFLAASLGKPLFALAVMLLVEQGKLDLDRPLVEYMPRPFVPEPGPLMAAEVADDPRLGLITPRMVLCHATGFPNWGEGRRLELKFTPGTGFEYSGEAYYYLQRVVEHVTGQPLESFLRHRRWSRWG